MQSQFKETNVRVHRFSSDIHSPVVSSNSVHIDVPHTPDPVVRRTVPRVGQRLQSEAKEYAKQRVELVFGEGWEEFEEIIQKESGWQVGRKAKNGACGLGQALPCSKLGNAYGDPKGEVDWTINYIRSRYKTPQKALEFWLQHRWY